MKPNKIIITGGIATGKSAASSYIKTLGYPLWDADEVAKMALEPGEKPYDCVVKHFSKDILLQDGTINRKKLANIIFSSDEKRKVLNDCTHPWIYQKLDCWIKKQQKPLLFLDIPLYYETSQEIDGEVWLIDAQEDIQMNRLIARNGLTKKEALARICAQMPMESKRKKADVIIDNSGSLEDLYLSIHQHLQERGEHSCKP